MMENEKKEIVPFNKMEFGTVRRAVIMGDPKTAERIYVGEAPMDAMSLAERDGIANGGPKSAIVSLAGNSAEGPLSVIYSIAKDRGNSVEWHYVGQNDVPNTVGMIMDPIYEADVREAINEGNPDAKIVSRRPPVQFKDWNDELRGISRPTPESSDQQAVDWTTRQQAKARLEGYDTPQPPVRKGPDFGI